MRIATATSVLFQHTIQDAIRLIASIGFDGVDIWGGRPYVYRNDLTAEKLVQLCHLIADHSLRVVSFTHMPGSASRVTGHHSGQHCLYVTLAPFRELRGHRC
jgi:sugar phosphate isomerase/epimerase